MLFIFSYSYQHFVLVEPSIDEIPYGTVEYNNTVACIYGCDVMFEKMTGIDPKEQEPQTYEEKICTEMCITKYF